MADKRLQFWINRSGQSPTSHDAVDGNFDYTLNGDVKCVRGFYCPDTVFHRNFILHPLLH